VKLTILVPCAGDGRRFVAAGHWLPKPMIPVRGFRTMLEAAVRSVRSALYSAPRMVLRMVFVARQEHLEFGLGKMIRKWAGGLVVPVDGPTDGAARTCLAARHLIDRPDPLLVMNCDQIVTGPDLKVGPLFQALTQEGGFDVARVLTMPADGSAKWSYVEFDGAGNLTGVREKVPVSDRATTGHYWFRRGADFVRAVDRMIAAGDRTNGEFYVAPALNHLFPEDGVITEVAVDRYGCEFHGLGTPEDLGRFNARHGGD
jgi:NDP-sugar pyrophosphorylase family protein